VLRVWTMGWSCVIRNNTIKGDEEEERRVVVRNIF
jgi:hypothetical protein